MVDRLRLEVPRGFDPSNGKHVEQVQRVAVQQRGAGWQFVLYDPASSLAHFERRDSVSQTDTSATKTATKVVSLGDGYGPADGEKAAARFESLWGDDGWVMTGYDPFGGKATLQRLTAAEVRCRAACAHALGVKPWDVQVKARRGGGFTIGLPASYSPSKHDVKLTEVATTAVGKPGWYVTVDVPNLRAQIIPADLPTFPAVIPYPEDVATRFARDGKQLLFGKSLAETGDKDGDWLAIDLGSSPHFSINGTTGAGKLLTLDTRIPTPTGWKLMADLQVGDDVLGRDGKPCQVTFVSDTNPNPDLYRVTMLDGRTVDACADHQWVVCEPAVPRMAAPVLAPTELAAALDQVADICRSQLDQWGLDAWASLDDITNVVAACPYSPWPTSELVRVALTFLDVPEYAGSYPARIAFHKLAARARFLADSTATLRRGEHIRTTSELVALGLERADGSARFTIRGHAPIELPAAAFDADPYTVGVACATDNGRLPAELLRGSIRQRLALLQGLCDAQATINRFGAVTLRCPTAGRTLQVMELVRTLGIHPKPARANRVMFTTTLPVFTDPERAGRLPAKQRERATQTPIVSITPIASRPGRCIQVDSPDATSPASTQRPKSLNNPCRARTGPE